MKTTLKIAAAALLTLAVVVLLVGTTAAQTAKPEASMDAFCDYCKDYTDAATAAETPLTAYRPGVGYAAEKDQAAAEQSRLQELARLRALHAPASELK